MALGTWNIHQSKIPIETTKIKARKAPKKVI
jgi:hypothetical protein